jgi:hypothetical protein
VTSIVTRKVQRDHPVGKYVVSLPIGWIRYVEAMSDHDTLNAVEMYEEDGCLAIQPAGLRRFGEGGEFVVSLMEKSEYKLRRKGKRRDFRYAIKDMEGHDKMVPREGVPLGEEDPHRASAGRLGGQDSLADAEEVLLREIHD